MVTQGGAPLTASFGCDVGAGSEATGSSEGYGGAPDLASLVHRRGPRTAFCTVDSEKIARGCALYYHAVCDLDTGRLLYSSAWSPHGKGAPASRAGGPLAERVRQEPGRAGAPEAPFSWQQWSPLEIGDAETRPHRLAYLRDTKGTLPPASCVVGEVCPVCQRHPPDAEVVCLWPVSRGSGCERADDCRLGDRQTHFWPCGDFFAADKSLRTSGASPAYVLPLSLPRVQPHCQSSARSSRCRRTLLVCSFL